MNLENYRLFAAQYHRTSHGKEVNYSDVPIKRGWVKWVEWGDVITAKRVNSKKFGGHAYDNGGYELGIRDCPCGCEMGSCSSSGPVDPFGPCPANPKS